jgi:hypothetical protein
MKPYLLPLGLSLPKISRSIRRVGPPSAPPGLPHLRRGSTVLIPMLAAPSPPQSAAPYPPRGWPHRCPSSLRRLVQPSPSGWGELRACLLLRLGPELCAMFSSTTQPRIGLLQWFVPFFLLRHSHGGRKDTSAGGTRRTEGEQDSFLWVWVDFLVPVFCFKAFTIPLEWKASFLCSRCIPVFSFLRNRFLRKSRIPDRA